MSGYQGIIVSNCQVVVVGAHTILPHVAATMRLNGANYHPSSEGQRLVCGWINQCDSEKCSDVAQHNLTILRAGRPPWTTQLQLPAPCHTKPGQHFLAGQLLRFFHTGGLKRCVFLSFLLHYQNRITQPR